MIILCLKVGRPNLVIFLECPQDVMEKRLLKRGETSGRSDDNLETIMKRFETFQKESLPVIAFYRKLKAGLVLQVFNTFGIAGGAFSSKIAMWV